MSNLNLNRNLLSRKSRQNVVLCRNSQVGDGRGVGEGPLGDDGDVVAVEGEDPQVLEAAEGVLLDALQPGGQGEQLLPTYAQR